MCKEEVEAITTQERQLPSTDELVGSSAPCLSAQQRNLGEQDSIQMAFVICTDKFRPRDVVCLSCPDIYCKGCLASYFIRTSTNETIYPPRCCGGKKIPITSSRRSCPGKIWLLLKMLSSNSQRQIGYTVPTQLVDGLSHPTRSARTLRTVLSDNETYIHCRHLGHEGCCPADKALQAVMKLGLDSGWQRGALAVMQW